MASDGFPSSLKAAPKPARIYHERVKLNHSNLAYSAQKVAESPLGTSYQDRFPVPAFYACFAARSPMTGNTIFFP